MSQIPADWSTFAIKCDLPNGKKFIPNKTNLNLVEEIEQNGSFCVAIKRKQQQGYTTTVINWLLHQALMSIEKRQDYAAVLVFPMMPQLKYAIDTAFCQADSVSRYTDGLIRLTPDFIKIYSDESVATLDFCSAKTIKKGCHYDAIFLDNVSIDRAVDSGLLPNFKCKKLIVIEEHLNP